MKANILEDLLKPDFNSKAMMMSLLSACKTDEDMQAKLESIEDVLSAEVTELTTKTDMQYSIIMECIKELSQKYDKHIANIENFSDQFSSSTCESKKEDSLKDCSDKLKAYLPAFKISPS